MITARLIDLNNGMTSGNKIRCRVGSEQSCESPEWTRVEYPDIDGPDEKVSLVELARIIAEIVDETERDYQGAIRLMGSSGLTVKGLAEERRVLPSWIAYWRNSFRRKLRWRLGRAGFDTSELLKLGNAWLIEEIHSLFLVESLEVNGGHDGNQE